ncbi:MAG TPA: AraC family transcriptional regulator [Usitatibacter sp.]|nr:AraC family transcriptional regulator [Usitatibacter sp.]
MSSLEALVRIAAIAWALAAALSLVVRRPRSIATDCAAFCAAGVCAFVLVSWSDAFRALGPIAFMLDGWCLASPFAFWLLARSLFEDGFAPSRALIASCASAVVLLLLADWGRFAIGPLAPWPSLAASLFFLLRAGSLLLVAHGAWEALAGWREDLVDARRRVRALFALVVGGAFAATVASTFVFPEGAPQPVRLVALALLACAMLVMVLIVASGTLHERLGQVLPAAPVPREAARGAVSPDAPLARRALEAMEHEALWRRERLSLGALARHLDVPEYRLRQAINGALGYRSFSAFVAHYRLEAASRALRDPAAAGTPILSIALDCGFNSVGPFNRAFRARFGVTPREYRAAGEAPVNDAPIPRIGETARPA